MSDDKNNVIQFPGRKKEEVKPEVSNPVENAAAVEQPQAKKARKRSKKTLAGTVLAIVLATGAVNRYAFDNSSNASSSSSGRGLASAESISWVRDAQWEREIAEKLASASVREVASTRIGRSATMEEKLRWGTLEEKYTINYTTEDQRIQNIFLQDKASEPSYVLDRAKFLKEYGTLFNTDFKAAKLKSVESTDEKTVEAYTIFDKQNKAQGEARFELDRHKRLLSLKVEPVQI
jgi:hypothetical protein